MKKNLVAHKNSVRRPLCSTALWVLLITLFSLACSPAFAQAGSVPFLNQWPTGFNKDIKNMNCGPTCCVMLDAALRDINPSSSELKIVLDFLGGNHRNYYGWINGYSVDNLVNVLKNHFNYPNAGHSNAGSLEDLKPYLDKRIPVIAHVSQVYDPNNSNHRYKDPTPHFIIVEGYDWNSVFIVDPGRTQESNGRGQYNVGEFNSIFKGPFVYPITASRSGQTPPEAQIGAVSFGEHDSRLEGSWQQSLFGFITMTITFRRDGTMTMATMGYSLEGIYSTSGDRYTMDYVIPGYGSYSSLMESAFQGSGIDPGIAGSGTFILSGDTLYLDGLQFTRIR